MHKKFHQLKKQYLALDLQQVIDYEKFSTISIVWHSTKIKGCALTELDTKVLLEKDITAAGKPLQDHLMIKDHYAAFQYMKTQAKQKRKFSVEFLKQLGALVMKHTGGFTNTALGSFDTSKGDLRLAQVYITKKYFPNYQKVPRLLEQFCEAINTKIDTVTADEVINLAADVHYNFVNIHPFGDGRVARLLMNYIALYHDEPLIKMFTEDRTDYINALNEAEEQENIAIFRDFILSQEIKFLKAEIDKHKKLNKGFNFLF